MEENRFQTRDLTPTQCTCRLPRPLGIAGAHVRVLLSLRTTIPTQVQQQAKWHSHVRHHPSWTFFAVLPGSCWMQMLRCQLTWIYNPAERRCRERMYYTTISMAFRCMEWLMPDVPMVFDMNKLLNWLSWWPCSAWQMFPSIPRHSAALEWSWQDPLTRVGCMRDLNCGTGHSGGFRILKVGRGFN